MEVLSSVAKSPDRAVIIVTHAPEIAEKYAKKIYWLRDGRVERVTKKFGSRWKTVNKKNKLK